jgi:hypothetical protein
MSTERKLSKKSDRPFYTRLDRTGRWIRGGSDKAAPPPLIKLEIFPFSNSSVIVYWYLNTYPIHWPIQLFIYWKWWIKDKLDHSNFYRNCEGIAETVEASHITYPW